MMAKAGLFIKAFIACIAAALIAYAVLPWGPEALLKLIALAAGVSILVPFAYFPIFGVRKGDGVSVERENPAKMPGIFSLLMGSGSGVAMESGKKGAKIMVALTDGSIRSCIIVSYPGFFSPAKVKLAGKGIEHPMEITVV